MLQGRLERDCDSLHLSDGHGLIGLLDAAPRLGHLDDVDDVAFLPLPARRRALQLVARGRTALYQLRLQLPAQVASRHQHVRLPVQQSALAADVVPV